MYIYPECAFKYAVVALDVHFLYVGIQLLVDDRRNLMQHTHAVYACNLYGYCEIQLFVSLPGSRQYPVAMAALQRVCNRAVALVYYDVLLFVVVPQYIVTGNGMAAVGNYISALEVFVGEVDCSFAVNNVIFLQICYILLLLLVAIECEQ